MKPPTYAPAYAAFFPHIAKIAHAHGYALAVHGSLMSDMDLLAAPWTDEAAPADVLMEAVRGYATRTMASMFGEAATLHGPEAKPHGRTAWTLSIGNAAVIDLSVMPLAAATAAQPTVAPEPARRMAVWKEGPDHAYLCKTCKHRDLTGDVYPCNCCWNPAGDMYQRGEPATGATGGG